MLAWYCCCCNDEKSFSTDEIVQPMRISEEDLELEKQLPHLLARNIMAEVFSEEPFDSPKDEASVQPLDVEAQFFSLAAAAQVAPMDQEGAKSPQARPCFDKVLRGLSAHDGDDSPATPTTVAGFRVASLASLSSAGPFEHEESEGEITRSTRGPPTNTFTTVATADSSGVAASAAGSKADVAVTDSSRRQQLRSGSRGSGGRQSNFSVNSVEKTLAMASAWAEALKKALQAAPPGSDEFILLESLQEKVWAAQEGLLNSRQMAEAATEDDSCRQAGQECLRLARKQLLEVEKHAVRIRAYLPGRRLPVPEAAAASPACRRASVETVSNTGTWAAPWKYFRQRTIR